MDNSTPSSGDTAIAVGIVIGCLALICLIFMFCRRRRKGKFHQNDLRGKPWDTITPVMSADDVSVSVMEEADKSTYMFVTEKPQEARWNIRPSNILNDTESNEIGKSKVPILHAKNGIVLLEDDEMMYLQSHRGPPIQQQTQVLQPPQPARPRLSTEDDSEAGDLVDEELSTRSTNSIANEMDGWSTNLSLVSEMSMLDSEHGDRMSTISFSSFDGNEDVMEAKI